MNNAVLAVPERVRSKMTIAGDAQMGLAPDGVPQQQGIVLSRLRDMARAPATVRHHAPPIGGDERGPRLMSS